MLESPENTIDTDSTTLTEMMTRPITFPVYFSQ